MKHFKISGIVDVNMYNTILDPGFVFENDDYSYWFCFNQKKYTEVVRERATVELKKMLTQLPDELQCSYIEWSARIDSPVYYNYRGDELHFMVAVADKNDLSENELQGYLVDFFLDDWNAEFGAAYRIYEYISGNYSIENFIYG